MMNSAQSDHQARTNDFVILCSVRFSDAPPGNTDSVCNTCPVRSGGGYGGNFDGCSGQLENEDGGEIIEYSS